MAAPDPRPTPSRRHWRLGPGDSHWPPLWREMHDPPASIRGAGRLEALTGPALAVVGTRRATLRGMAVSRGLGAALARCGWVVVSGLARGIDAAAHEGALEAGGLSVAVMATGLDRTYPPGHADLRRRLEEGGCVVTEQADGVDPMPFTFPRRNRLVAGMVSGVIVVEAPRRSGALITAMLALDENREVFAVPGPVDCEQSRGCHHLLREGAHLLESLDDVRRVLEFPAPPAQGGEAGRIFGPPEPAPGTSARWILDRLDLAGVPEGALRRRWRGGDGPWHEGLLALEMAGWIRRLPGGRLARRMPTL